MESYRLSLPSAESTRHPIQMEEDMAMYEAYSSDEFPDNTENSSGSEEDGSSSEEDGSSSDVDSSSSDADNSSSDGDSTRRNEESSADSNDDTLLHSINSTVVSYDQPEPMDESSIVDTAFDEAEATDEVPEYQIIKSSSQRQDKLIDRYGYSFSVKASYTTYWHCSVRNKITNFKATVIQRGAVFTPGMHPHIHQAQTGSAIAP